MLDSDGYPRDEVLDRITEMHFLDALDLVGELWSYPWAYRKELTPKEAAFLMFDHGELGKLEVWRFLTGGWSGNESLIGALRENLMVWGFAWQVSTKSGLHIFAANKVYRQLREEELATEEAGLIT